LKHVAIFRGYGAVMEKVTRRDPSANNRGLSLSRSSCPPFSGSALAQGSPRAPVQPAALRIYRPEGGKAPGARRWCGGTRPAAIEREGSPKKGGLIAYGAARLEPLGVGGADAFGADRDLIGPRRLPDAVPGR